MIVSAGLPDWGFLQSALFIKLFLLLISLVFLVVTVTGLVGTVRRSRRVAKVPGVVVDLLPGSTGSGGGTQSRVYRPMLLFRTLDGRDVQAESTVANNPPVAEPGQQVRVAYEPGDPTEAYVDNVWGSGTVALVVGFIAAAAVFIGLGISLLNDLD